MLAVLGVGAAVPRAADAADLSATPANLSSVFNAAQGGDTIHLAAGDYGTFKGGSKTATVTLTGAGATLGADFTGAQNLRFDGITVNGATLVSSRNIAFVNSTFTGMSVVRASSSGAGILFDHDSFNGISPCSTCYEGRITVVGTSQPAGAAGVVISNSSFSGGNADGVQLTGEADGVQIGPGNEFTGLGQSSVVHTDPIQLYGADNTVILGNYIHDDATGIMAPDGGDGAVTITNNVFANIEQPGIYLGYKPSARIEHNTISGAAIINDDPTKSGTKTSGATIKNNVITGGLALQNLLAGALALEDYNLMSGAGAHDLRSAAQFVGGARPTTMAGFALVAGSPGTHAADDGTDMGAFGFVVGGGAGGAVGATPKPPAVAAAAPKAPAAGATGSSAPAKGSPPTSTTAGAAAAAAAAAGYPTVVLTRPTAGARHSRTLHFTANAADNHGIRRVEFWVDGTRVASDRTAPYGRTWKGWSRLSRGHHTATARAVSIDGQIASQSVSVLRGAKRPHSTRARAAWSVQSTPAAGATVLAGSGVPGERVAVRLARCGSRTGKTAVRRVLTASGSGQLSATVSTPGLCVAKLAAL